MALPGAQPAGVAAATGTGARVEVEASAQRRAGRLPDWWPLAALLVLAAAVRLSTIGLQSFWFDEAFTPVHVLHGSIVASMETMAHTENSPPLWYVTIWAWTRIFGTGAVAMRLPSALAGIGLVWVLWQIGYELAGRRAAIAAAAIAAVNPLFVWYSQEARTYEFYALAMALAVLCFIRAEREPTGRRMAAFAVTGALALLCHYFAVFLLVPMALWLLRRRERWRVALPAVAAIGVVGLALIPLVLSQGGRGTQWIGQWPLIERLEAIPQYYLTGYSGEPLGRGIQLLMALPILAGLGFGLLRTLQRRERGAALSMLSLAACGVLIPIAIIAVGADYLAPRNLIGAMVPLTAMIAVVAAATQTGRLGMAIVGVIAAAFLAICIDVDLTPRLQRGDWSGVAAALQSPAPAGGATAGAGRRAGAGSSPSSSSSSSAASGGAGPAGSHGLRAIATVHLGSAPLRYYMPGLRTLPAKGTVRLREIDEVGYSPLLASAGTPPAPGFKLLSHDDVNGLVVYRFVSATPRPFTTAQLRADAITAGEANLLGSAAVAASVRGSS